MADRAAGKEAGRFQRPREESPFFIIWLAKRRWPQTHASCANLKKFTQTSCNIPMFPRCSTSPLFRQYETDPLSESKSQNLSNLSRASAFHFAEGAILAEKPFWHSKSHGLNSFFVCGRRPSFRGDAPISIYHASGLL